MNDHNIRDKFLVVNWQVFYLPSTWLSHYINMVIWDLIKHKKLNKNHIYPLNHLDDSIKLILAYIANVGNFKKYCTFSAFYIF